MREFWKLTDCQRADLTDDQVEECVKVELMAKGIVRPELTRIPQPECNLPAKLTYYVNNAFNNVAFATKDRAEEFTKLSPMYVDYDYKTGSEFSYAKPRMGVVQERSLYSFSDFQLAAEGVAKFKAAEKSLESQLESAETASSQLASTTSGVWEDYYRCSRIRDRYEAILRTREEYQDMADDEELADKFLCRAYSKETVVEALEWFAKPVPDYLRDSQFADTQLAEAVEEAVGDV